MGRVFVEEAINATGIDRTNLVVVATYLVRTKQATSAIDAIRRLENGEFDKAELEEEMIRFFQHEKPKPVEEEPIIDVDSFNNKQQKHEAEIEEIFSKEVDTDKWLCYSIYILRNRAMMNTIQIISYIWCPTYGRGLS